MPYTCKKCGKEMWSLNEVVEYWDDIYCWRCAPKTLKTIQPETNNIQKEKELAGKVLQEAQKEIQKVYKKGDYIGQEYEVYDVLGEGGFGIVYLVYSHKTESVHALKTFRDEYLEDNLTRERFKKECQVWIDLERHTYIVQANFVEEIANRLFINIEYIAPNDHGLKSLEDYLKYQPPDFTQSLIWAIQFCHGMEYAYSKGIKAHRDIKPENIMIGQDKAVKISDFGLAGVIGSSRITSGIKVDIQKDKVGFCCQTMEGTGFGTPTHMPPEQFINAAGCDERSDIYSFGIVLFQMISGGKLPFLAALPKNNAYEESRRFWAEMYMLHSQAIIPKLNTPLFPIIFRSLEKNPVNRYFSFKELRRDLESLLKKQTGEVIKIPEQKEMKAWEWYNKGASLANLGKHQEAMVCYERAIEINPKDALAWNYKGAALCLLDKPQEAITCFDRAIELNPKDASAWDNKGVVLGKQGRHEDALKCYDCAIELNPKNANAWYNKGDALGTQGRYEEALKCFDRAVELNPKDALTWINKGVVLGKQGRYEEALKYCGRAIELNPKYEAAWLGKGGVLEKLGKPQEAIACYDKALEINPRYAYAWWGKGVALFALGKYQEAIACYDRAIEINPRYAEAWNNKGVALGRLNKPQEEIGCYDRALEINPIYAEAWGNKALSEDKLCQRQDAIFSYKQFIEIAPAQYKEQVEHARQRLRELKER